MIDKVRSFFRYYPYKYIFLLIAVPWGFIQVFLMPPYQTPDEVTHFYRSWGLAHAQAFCTTNYELEISKNITTLAEQFDVQVIGRGIFSPTKIYDSLNASHFSEEKSIVYSSACPYSPVGYMPQAVGIILSESFGLPPLGTFYLSRLSNLAIALTFVFFAISITPVGKPIFVAISLLPMTIHQFSSVNNDALNIAGLMFFTAIILNASRKGKLESKQLCLIFISSLLLTQVKPGYVIFLLFLFMLNSKQFKGKAKYASFLILNFASSLLLLFFINKLNIPDHMLQPQGGGVNIFKQIEYIIDYPLKYIAMFSNDILFNPLHLHQLIGVQGPLIIIYFTDYFYNTFLIAFLVLIFIRDGEEKFLLTQRERLLLLLVSVSELFAVSTIIYITWNALGSGSLNGMHGRYLIPISMIGMLGIYGITKLKSNNLLKLYMLCFFIIVSSVSINRIYSYYYRDNKEYLAVSPKGDSFLFEPFIKPDTELDKILLLQDNRLKSLSSGSYIEISIPSNIKGISWVSTAKGLATFYYLIDGINTQFSEKFADIVPNTTHDQYFVNIDILRNKKGHDLIKLRIYPTNELEEFRMFEFKIYR